jgi:hypothetical protein
MGMARLIRAKRIKTQNPAALIRYETISLITPYAIEKATVRRAKAQQRYAVPSTNL